MKRLAALLILAALPALAEKGADDKKGGPMKEPDPKEMAAKKADHMEKFLGLKPDQKAKIKAILETEMAEMVVLKKKMQELQRGNHEKIRAMLDDEQKEKLDMMRARHGMMRGHMKEKFIERRERRMEMRDSHGGPDREDGDDRDDD